MDIAHKVWTTLTSEEREQYTHKLKTFGYDVSTPTKQEEAWLSLITSASKHAYKNK